MSKSLSARPHLLRTLALAACLLPAALGCDKGGTEKGEKGEAPKTAAEGALGAAAVKIDEVRDLVKEGAPISAKQYEMLILAHASCDVTDSGIDPKCEAVKIMRESMNRSQLAKGALGGNSDLGLKLIGHESPAVRIKAAGLMGSLLGTGAKSQDAIVDALAKEKHPAVIAEMIRTVRNDGAKNARVGKMLLEMADHENPKIRKEAVYGLSSSWNKELSGGPEKLIAKMTQDSDTDVRKAACENAGGLGDAKLFPVYQKLLGDRTDGAVWGACFKGLVSMWGDYPLYGTSSEAAYKLTLTLLQSKPRTKDIPPWAAMSTFGQLGSTTNKKLDEWKAKATWYRPADLRAALASVVADSDANWMARTGATKSLGLLGASKADLTKLRAPLGAAPTGTDTHVAKELDTAIGAAK